MVNGTVDDFYEYQDVVEALRPKRGNAEDAGSETGGQSAQRG